MNMKTQASRQNQKGNALFLILIAVALFAALSYAVTQSNRGSGSVEKEQAIILASQVTQFPATVRTGITRMIITGTAATALDFGAPSGDPAEVFDSVGGGVVPIAPPANALVSPGSWIYLPASHSTDGWFIQDVGTNTDTAGREVVALLRNLKRDVCNQINRGLGLGTPAIDATPPTAATAALAQGTTTSTFNSNPAEPFACYQETNASGQFSYYHALVEQ
jgi:hypothetical protein